MALVPKPKPTPVPTPKPPARPRSEPIAPGVDRSYVPPVRTGSNIIPNSYLSTLPQNRSLGGSGGSSGGGQPFQMPQFQQPEQPSIDFDALIRPAIDALEGTIPTLQQGFSEYQTGQEANRNTLLGQNTQQINEQTGILERGKVQQGQAGESAVDEARRQFSEIQQGLQARYGGTTGTGAFASEIAGRETLGNISGIRTNVSNIMQGIDDKLVQVKEVGRLAADDINNKTQDRISQAKQNLDLQIGDIRKQQGMLQAQKAQMAAESIQQYQNSVNQFKMQQQQFLQDLYGKQYQAELELKSAQAKAKQIGSSFSVQDLTGLAKQFTPAGLQFSATGKLGQGGTFQNPSFSLGPVKQAEDDYLKQLINQE